MKIGAVILAAGSGQRFGGNKILALLGGRPVWTWSYQAFSESQVCDEIVVVGPVDDIRPELPDVNVVAGGTTRQESAQIGVKALAGQVDAVLIHDAARPFPSKALIQRVAEAVMKFGASAPVIPVQDTIRIWDTDGKPALLDRSRMNAMQTPQGAMVKDILRGYAEVDQPVTDDIAILESIGVAWQPVDGETGNFKITTQDDLDRAERMLSKTTRVGFGYDAHRFSTDPLRPMFLGGVHLDGPGLEGHSDADVLIHAICDALLGAMAKGDIGEHFPPSDMKHKDRRSTEFLKVVAEIARQSGFTIQNIDATVVAETPKVMPFAHQMKQAIGGALEISGSEIGIKATTNEGMGSIGRREGIIAFAVATVVSHKLPSL